MNMYDDMREATKVCLNAVFWLLIWLFLFWAMTCPARAYTNEEAIKAIIGEAESEPYIGKVAIGEVIRKRGSLKGIYGINAPRVRQVKYSHKCYLEAQKAWYASITSDYSHKSEGWGNANDLIKFKRSKWFKKCYIVCKIGNHYFWGTK
jgi:hypothetical protein